MLQPMNGVGTAMEREANASSGSPDTKFSAAAAGIVPSQNARIQVIGVGGGGSNAINRMIASELHGVGFWVLNTDAQALLNSAASQRVQLGMKLTPQLLFQFPTLGLFVSNLEKAGGQVDTSKLNKLEALLDEMEEV